jgi:hypothetical protein
MATRFFWRNTEPVAGLQRIMPAAVGVSDKLRTLEGLVEQNSK